MLDQHIIPKLIFFFILITYLVDIVLIMLGEILSWSLMGVKGLIGDIGLLRRRDATKYADVPRESLSLVEMKQRCQFEYLISFPS